MKFWASSEVYQPAGAASERARHAVEPYLNEAFSASSLATLEGKLRYVPIIMPVGMRERYPARSKLRKKERIYDCAPQLNYDVFVEGTFKEQLQEYVRGISESSPYLVGLGATPQQVADFDRIMATTVDGVLAKKHTGPSYVGVDGESRH
jgi:hypothetical protein